MCSKQLLLRRECRVLSYKIHSCILNQQSTNGQEKTCRQQICGLCKSRVACQGSFCLLVQRCIKVALLKNKTKRGIMYCSWNRGRSMRVCDVKCAKFVQDWFPGNETLDGINFRKRCRLGLFLTWRCNCHKDVKRVQRTNKECAENDCKAIFLDLAKIESDATFCVRRNFVEVARPVRFWRTWSLMEGIRSF